MAMMPNILSISVGLGNENNFVTQSEKLGLNKTLLKKYPPISL